MKKTENNRSYHDWIDTLPRAASIDFKLRISAQLLNRYWQTVLDDHSLTTAQWGILAAVSATDGITYSRIKERLQQLGGTTSALVEDLDSRKLLKKQQDKIDKRVWRIYLTPAGKRLVQKLAPQVQKHREDIYSCFTKQQQKELSQALDVLITKLFAFQD